MRPVTPIRSALRVLAVVLVAAASWSAPPLAATPGAATEILESAPRAAGEGTLVYVKGHDVYVARPDGSGERRLTDTGTAGSPWRTPSQSDAGEVVAARGTVIYRMDQWGTVLNSFDPPDLRDSAGDRIGGQVRHAVVSPDGRKIAYTYGRRTCPPLLACRMRYATAVSAADRLTPVSRYGVLLDDNPAWVTKSRLIANNVGYDSIYVFDLGGDSRFWFHDAQASTDFHPLFEPVVSRDGRAFAAVRGEGDQAHVVLGRVTGNIRSGPVPTWPTYLCAMGRRVESPAFAPDGSALAWAQSDGVRVKPVPQDCAVQPELTIPGGRSPHWSAASLQASQPDNAFDLLTRPALRLPGQARPGVRVRATAGTWRPSPSAVGYRWLRDGRPIRGATARVYRLTRADAGHRVSVRVTVSRPKYQSSSVQSRSVRVRR